MKITNTLRQFMYILPVLFALITGCGEENVKPSFKNVWGIKYTEVKRRMANGLSIDKYGYQQVPSWELTFPVDDSAYILSPDKGRFYYFPVTFDHDSAVNMAQSWMRIRKVTRDSLVFKLMKVEGRFIYLDAPDLYMTLYADSYIKNKLKTTADRLRTPSKADSAFVKQLSAFVNTHTDTAFAATQPVMFTSTSPDIKVEKVSPPDDYMTPEFNITINKAYKDFHFRFSMYVDDKGRMRFRKTLLSLGDFVESKTRIIKGLIAGYMMLYLKTTPGKTLGITHTSAVVIDLTGVKG